MIRQKVMIMRKSVDWVGQKNKNKQGMDMEIAAYRSDVDIDIRFDDGSFVRNKFLHNFLSGNILHPSYEED